MLIHNNKLRVNSEVPEETLDIWREAGWAAGKHKDTDPDDRSAVPKVLPLEPDDDDEPEPEPPAKPARATPKDKQ